MNTFHKSRKTIDSLNFQEMSIVSFTTSDEILVSGSIENFVNSSTKIAIWIKS